jgi:uncharacterized membrane protein YecN with MAPEG domain
MPTPAMPIVAALTAGLLLIGQMLLLLLTVLRRRGARQSLGDGGDEGVLRAVRRHGKFAENAAIFVIGLALLEMLGAERQTVEILAAVFVAGRVLHALGLSMPKSANPFRTLGVVATVVAAIALAVRLVMLSASQLTLPW